MESSQSKSLFKIALISVLLIAFASFAMAVFLAFHFNHYSRIDGLTYILLFLFFISLIVLSLLMVVKIINLISEDNNKSQETDYKKIQEEKNREENFRFRQETLKWDKLSGLIDKITEKHEEIISEGEKDVKYVKIELRKDLIELIKKIKIQCDEI